jgi:PAS domain S-box-containing protein
MSHLIERDPTLRLLADIEGLWRLGRAVSVARSVGEIAPEALDALDRTVRPDRSAVLLFDDEGVMRFRAWRGLSEAYREAVEGHSPWRPDTREPRSILVEDAAGDPELTELWPTIEAEGIRALAFVPLAARGRVLGKFMLYHDRPHAFTDDEVLVAEAIAAHIAFAIDRQAAEVDLERSRQLLDVITRGLADGVTVQDRSGTVVYANDAAAAMSGLSSPAEMLATPVAELFSRFEMLDEEGAPFPLERLPGRRVLRGEPTAAATMQVHDRLTGERSWREVKAGHVLDDDGQVAFAVNIMENLTVRKRLERDLAFQKRLLELQSEATLEGILVVSPDGRIISHNRRFSEMWGMPDSVLTWPDADRIRFIRDRVVDDGGFVERVDELYAHPTDEGVDELELRDGRVIERSTAPIADDGAILGRAWFFRDVTERRRAADEQRFLAEASEILASSLDHERTLRQVAEVAVLGVADWCTIHLVDAEGTHRLEVAHRDPVVRERARDVLGRSPSDPSRPNLVREAIERGRPIVIDEVTDEMLGADDEHLDLLRELGSTSTIVVPLRARGATFGAITFISSSPAHRLSRDDLPLFEELARRAAVAIDNARLYERERTTATTLQESLLPPHLPEIAGLDAAALFVPFGDGAVVGGDLYDLLQVGPDRWLAVIGDVCGHGPRAAAIGSSVRHAVRVAALHDPTPSRVLDVVDRVLLDRRDDTEFCTACVVMLQRDDDGFRLTSSSAGHPLPLVLRADGDLEEIGKHGTLLGAFDDATRLDVTGHLRRGDTLVLFTDGLEERRCGAAFFGDEAFATVMRGAVGMSADGIVEDLRVALRDFGTAAFADDVAILALQAT